MWLHIPCGRRGSTVPLTLAESGCPSAFLEKFSSLLRSHAYLVSLLDHLSCLPDWWP